MAKGEHRYIPLTGQDIKMHKIVHEVIKVLLENRITISDALPGLLNANKKTINRCNMNFFVNSI